MYLYIEFNQIKIPKFADFCDYYVRRVLTSPLELKEVHELTGKGHILSHHQYI